MTEGTPDTGYYQTAPYGSGTTGTNVDYQHFNPQPAGSMYSPIPTNPGPTPASSAPGYGPSSSRSQMTPVPQASSRNNGPRGNRMSQSSQTIPTGQQEVRQTNYAAPLGLPANRRGNRTNSGNPNNGNSATNNSGYGN